MSVREREARIGGVILAGGAARRMGGGDKGLLLLDERPILTHVVQRLGPQVAALALNANGATERFAVYGLPVLEDALPDGVEALPGPLAGVLAGLDWAKGEGLTHIVTAAADTPFFPRDLGDRLQSAAVAEAQPIALAATPGPDGRPSRHPTFGLWPVDLAEDLRGVLVAGTRKIVAWTDAVGCATALFGAGDPDPFFNVNTPEDLDRAREIAAAGGPAGP